MTQEKHKNNLDQELTRLYPILLDKCRGLLRDRDNAREMLHTVLADVMGSEKRIATITSLIECGTLEFYLNRCIYLSARSQTSQYNRAKSPAIELDDFLELRTSYQQWIESDTSRNMIAHEESIDIIINQLPSFDGELLRLWMMPEFNYRIAAETTGIPIRVMYASIHESISKLKKYVHNPHSTSIRSAE